MYTFPITACFLFTDWRLYFRTQRILSERTKLVAERKLRKDQAIESGKIEHATLIGHIGKEFY